MIEKICNGYCCGCSACYAVCPKSAITMQENEKGFMTPVVSEQCIECGLCMRVCNQQDKFHKVKHAYIGKLRDKALLSRSQSGGAFTAIAEVILSKGGVVYGVALDKKLEAHHIRISSSKELEKLKGSKYVQSRIEECLISVYDDLKVGKLVLFSGTPCQVAGLYRFLCHTRIDIKKLYTIDLICHGTPSVLIWRSLLQYYQEKYHEKIHSVQFRDKQAGGGWGSHVSSLHFNNRIVIDNFHRGLFYSNLALCDSCYECKYTQTNRIGDITISDAWGVKEKDPDFYDEGGVSLILENTEKASKLIKVLSKEMFTREVIFESYLQEPLHKPSKPHRNKEEFWNDYHIKSFSYIISKYAKKNIFLNWKYILKKVRDKLHVR